MPKSLVDTDILSEIMKGHDPTVTENARRYLMEFEVLSFTSLTVFEVIRGLRQKGAEVQIKKAEVIFVGNE